MSGTVLHLVLKDLPTNVEQLLQAQADLVKGFESITTAEKSSLPDEAALWMTQAGAYVVARFPAGDGYLYHRYLLSTDTDATQDGAALAEEITADLRFNVVEKNKNYVSTRGSSSSPSSKSEGAPYRFLDVIREGLASDGGLFMPEQLPKFPKALLARLSSQECSSYIETAQLVLERLADPAMLSPLQLSEYLAKAYAADRWTSSKGVTCPVVPLDVPSTDSSSEKNAYPIYLLELFHGPTAAFKDFALQLFPYLFQLSIAEEENRYVILAATSGDTGVAVIDGIRRSQAPNLRVMVLYPNRGVSPVQKIQMVSADGASVRVVGVESDFDFCQSTVKHIFNDQKTNEKLNAEEKVTLSSANSINWGRLVPQIVYYFFGYGELVRKHGLKHGATIDVCVPTGNFGNILSCFFAKKMGLPVRRFVLASNENDVLYEFLRTGVYNIKTRTMVPTESPSIDILRASNIERLLYLLADGDTAFVKSMMEGLNGPEKQFEVTAAMKTVLQTTFWSMRCDRSTCAKTLGDVFASTKNRPEGHYLLDPHTAVAVYAAQEYTKEVKALQVEERPILLAATAQWAKFPPAVMEALKLPLGDDFSNGGGDSAKYKMQDSAAQVAQWYRDLAQSSAKSHSGGLAVEAAIPLGEMIAKISANTTTSANDEGARVSEASVEQLTAAVVEFSS